MLKILAALGASPGYWLAVLVFGLSMEAVALYYQYALEYWPCVLCIHVRIWVTGFILVGLLALVTRRSRPWRIVLHLFTVVLSIGLLERAWMLLGVERGTLEGSCNMESGLPGWFALDAWFPWLFKVWEACGYTPQLLFGITMAEALVALGVLLVLVTAALTLATLSVRSV